MNINLSRLISREQDVLEFCFCEQISSIGEEENKLVFLDSIQMKGQIKRVQRRFYLTANLITSIKKSCDRCLKEVKVDIESDIEGFLVSRAEDFYDENVDVFFYHDEEFDLIPIIEDQVLLCIPQKVLCNQDCNGICLGCGKDLNTETCECQNQKPEVEIDPRLAKLKELL